MRRGQIVLVENLTVCGLPAVESRPIPRADSGLLLVARVYPHLEHSRPRISPVLAERALEHRSGQAQKEDHPCQIHDELHTRTSGRRGAFSATTGRATPTATRRGPFAAESPVDPDSEWRAVNLAADLVSAEGARATRGSNGAATIDDAIKGLLSVEVVITRIELWDQRDGSCEDGPRALETPRSSAETPRRRGCRKSPARLFARSESRCTALSRGSRSRDRRPGRGCEG